MAQIERLYRIEQMLQNQQTITFEQLKQALEVSPATLKRDLSYLRDRLGVPVIYDRFALSYRLDQPAKGRKVELPGLWFTADELKALLTMHKLLSDLDTSGLLGVSVDALLLRIKSLMGTNLADVETLLQRVQLRSTGARRSVNPASFHTVSTALLNNKRLELDYKARHSNALEHREISPQRLVYYRDNWYLVAFCHSRQALRVFSLDQMSHLHLANKQAQLLPPEALTAAVDAGYGIFQGGELLWAEILFRGDSVRWVQDQHWHTQQQMTWQPDGSLLLQIPYLNPAELAVDIMSWGAGCEVLSPASLRFQVRQQLQQALAQYAAVDAENN
ncbi:MAG: WYL domain-containing protein [Burkholderiaceae bacterium]